MAEFTGRLVHPQHWPADLHYAGKRVVVIGSGATAVTLVPAMAMGSGAAAHVTMLQRSPTYVASLPSVDIIANTLRRVLPSGVAYAVSRWKNVLRSMFFYYLARAHPDTFRKALRKEAVAQLGDEFPFEAHFSPRYKPWDERLCMVPDGDLFIALREQRASIVTDHIDHIDATGIQLQSGAHLDADIIVAATGLRMSILTGVTLVVDGDVVQLNEKMVYKGAMLSDVPNMAAAVGYTNASWTLKCDLIAEHVCRLLNYMRDGGFVQVTPRRGDDVTETPVFDFTSGYVQRALPRLPKQGDRAPWRLYQNYIRDLVTLRYGRVDDPALEFRRAPDTRATLSPPAELAAHG
jgi:cation diffusion facilitator CzcD-associated flavoprotein CzcO